MDLINFIFKLDINPIIILFILVSGIIGYLRLTIQALKSELESMRAHSGKLKEQYHLHDRHILTLSILLEPVIKRKLIKQAENGEWRTAQPLNGD